MPLKIFSLRSRFNTQWLSSVSLEAV